MNLLSFSFSIPDILNGAIHIDYVLILIQFVLQKKVIEIREQLRRTALRLGIVLKSCEGDMLVGFAIIY
jgi:hypothetical protein